MISTKDKVRFMKWTHTSFYRWSGGKLGWWHFQDGPTSAPPPSTLDNSFVVVVVGESVLCIIIKLIWSMFLFSILQERIIAAIFHDFTHVLDKLLFCSMFLSTGSLSPTIFHFALPAPRCHILHPLSLIITVCYTPPLSSGLTRSPLASSCSFPEKLLRQMRKPVDGEMKVN